MDAEAARAPDAVPTEEELRTVQKNVDACVNTGVSQGEFEIDNRNLNTRAVEDIAKKYGVDCTPPSWKQGGDCLP